MNLLPYVRQPALPSRIQEAAVGMVGYDRDHQRWYVYARLDAFFGWVRITRWKKVIPTLPAAQ